MAQVAKRMAEKKKNGESDDLTMEEYWVQVRRDRNPEFEESMYWRNLKKM